MLNTKNDLELTPGPTDGASSLSFSPVADYLAATSWDGQTRIWEVNSNGSSMAKAAIPHDGPSLSCAWSGDGMKCFSGGADKTVKILDLSSGQTMSFAAHDQAVRSMRWVSAGNVQALVTGSWDKTLKYWDLRSPQPLATVQLPERCYAMDSASDLLVVGTAERHVLIFNLANPGQPFKTMQSPLKWQTRTIACFNNGSGFAIGSIEGRVGLQYIGTGAKTDDNFAFKCHRDDKMVYPVNAISFHPTFGTFSTSGADGYIHIWDKDSRQRLESSTSLGAPIQATAFNRTGSLFAYALGYDWFKGHEFYEANAKNAIMIHPVAENDVKPRQSAAFRRR